jgi:hypothetical protein
MYSSRAGSAQEAAGEGAPAAALDDEATPATGTVAASGGAAGRPGFWAVVDDRVYWHRDLHRAKKRMWYQTGIVKAIFPAATFTRHQAILEARRQAQREQQLNGGRTMPPEVDSDRGKAG